MPFDVTIILPSNLSSGYLQSEFINSGDTYTSNKYSKDPSLDNNKNTLTFSFEVRDKATRSLSTFTRIKALYLSNDQQFDPASTIAITNFPSTAYTFDNTFNYEYTFNPLYFFDRTLTQGSMSTPTAGGTGLFKVYNWPLSASGGLSTVYLKALLEGPNGEDIEYPQGYGVFDQILWEGEIPVNPTNPEIPSGKVGWVGKNTLVSFTSGNQSSAQQAHNGIGRYLSSLYEVSNTTGTFDAYSAKSSTKRSILPSASIASTSLQSYRYNGSTYSSASLSLGANIGLTSQSFGKGAFFYSNTKLIPSSDKTDFYTQAGFSYTTSGVAVTTQVYLKLYAAPETAANSNEIVCRLDVPNDGAPISYLYTVSNGTISTNKQITNLPNSVLPLIKSGGLIEMYYSSMGTTNICMVEAYFTPYLDQSSASTKSYLLSNAMLTSFGTSSIGSAFGCQISSSVGTSFDGGIILDELFMAQGKAKLSVDVGDCSLDDIDMMSYPSFDIPHSWSEYENEDFLYLTDAPSGLTVSKTTSAESVSVSKIDSTSAYEVNAFYEMQFYKPSFSGRSIFEVEIIHGSDDFYVAFSPVSSYRSHTEKNLTVNWDRPFGVRCDENYAYTDAPLNAETVLVKFSGEKNEITVSQRTSDNKLTKHVLRSYTPSSEKKKFVFEITDQVPNGYKGRYKTKHPVGSWLSVKETTSSNINLLGSVNMLMSLTSNSYGLGYFAALGWKESSYSSSNNQIFKVKYSGVPNIYKEKYDNDSSIRSVLLADEGLTNSSHYLGQKLLSGQTDFVGFNYKNALTIPVKTFNAAVGTTSALPNSPSFASNTFTSGTATTLYIDGYNLSENDVILVKNESTGTRNGLYYVSRVGTASTTWQLKRSTSFDSSDEVVSNTLVRVDNGSTNKETKWYLTTPDPITLGSTGVTFSNTSTVPTNVQVATTGTSITVSSLESLTIDDISISSLSVGSYVLVKDQVTQTENGIYQKSTTGWTLVSALYDAPFKVVQGTVNANTYWYKTRIPVNGEILDRFVSTTYFKNMTVSEISPFISATKPGLFEFKVNWEDYDTPFPINDIKVRFYANSGSLPDSTVPLTSWKGVSYNPYVAGFSVAPNNHLVQVKFSESEWNTTVSQSDSIWVAINIPFNSSLAEANGKNFNNRDYIYNEKFSGYKIANNLWHKLHARYEEKSINSVDGNSQNFRVRAISHGELSSFATNISTTSLVDITAPSYNNDVPYVTVAEESNLRSLQISISTEDNKSGLLAFRVGKEIDNSYIQYTPWLPWDKYVVSSVNQYFIYLHGHLNYYNSGPAFDAFAKQNIGFSGSRKIWVQVMDYMGNISESNPLTFVASSQALVDTQPPLGGINFYDPRTNQIVDFTNLKNAWMKTSAYDLVTGIKDFKIRKLLDSGAGSWSEWTPFGPYVKVDFSGEDDGVKKVEIKYRDFGNNITQPEVKWNPIKRPKV